MNIAEEFWRDVTTLGGFVAAILYLLIPLALLEFALFWQLFWGLAIVTLINFIIRVFYFKERPRKEKHKNYFEKIIASAFPSLHTSRAFVVALILAGFLDNMYMSGLLIILAILVGFSRLYLKKHDWWDVLGGVVTGILGWGIVSYLL